MGPRPLDAPDVAPAADAALADDDLALRHELGEPLGDAQVGLEGAQVAVVDPQDLGLLLEGCLDLALVVDLHETLEPEALCDLHQLPQQRPRQHGHDEQDGVGAMGPCLEDLVRVKDELLAEYRDRLGSGHSVHTLQVLDAALEVVDVGEDRYGRGPILHV